MKIKIEITTGQTDIFNNTEYSIESHEVSYIESLFTLDWVLLDYISTTEYNYLKKVFKDNWFLTLKEKGYINFPKIEDTNSSKRIELKVIDYAN